MGVFQYEARNRAGEFFAGTVIRMAERHGLDVPVNRELYRKIKEMEAGYKGIG